MPDLKGSSAAPPLILLQPLREGVEHFSELLTPDPPCHFCRENISRPVHEDCTRLKIVSRGKSEVDADRWDSCTIRTKKALLKRQTDGVEIYL